MKKVTPEQSNNTYDKKDGKWQIDKINDDGDFINALSCLFARRAVRRFARQNGAVSSTPAEAGELSHETFHSSRVRWDRSSSNERSELE